MGQITLATSKLSAIHSSVHHPNTINFEDPVVFRSNMDNDGIYSSPEGPKLH